MKEERFPHTRKPLRGQRLRVAEGGRFGATEESAATGMRRAKRRDSRTEGRCRAALTSPRGLSAQPPGQAGLGAEAQASALAGRESGKSLQLPKRQETFSCLFVSRRARRGDSECRLNELQRRARAAAISADPRDGCETLRLLLPPPKSLCASTGHSPHRPSWEPVQPTIARLP